MKVKYLIPILLIVLVFSFAGCTPAYNSAKTIESLEKVREENNSKETLKTNNSSSDSVEYKMATIDNGYIDKNDSKISNYKLLLDSLEEKTINGRIDISDITVTAQRLLRERGIDMTLLQILRDLDNSIPEGLTGMKLEEIASAYMVLMTE